MDIINGKSVSWEDELEATTSIRFVGTGAKDSIRNYEGLFKDIAKLPKADELATGSSFLALDTAEVYKYEQTTKTWFLL